MLNMHLKFHTNHMQFTIQSINLCLFVLTHACICVSGPPNFISIRCYLPLYVCVSDFISIKYHLLIYQPIDKFVCAGGLCKHVRLWVCVKTVIIKLIITR